MKKIVLSLLATVMLTAVPCLAFDFPGHEGQIPLCQNNKTGALRVAPVKDIDPTTGVDYEPYCNTRFFYGTTTPTETLIWINIQGIQGSQGLQGIQGDKGDKGDQGLQGIQGIKGDKGDQGIQGLKGDKGDQGIQGLQGLQGIQGDKGDKGDKGDQGIQGLQGPVGSDASCVKLTGDTMTGTLNAPSLIVPQISTSFPGTNLSISAATGTGNGGAINISAGTGGTSSGGSGGDINITAGTNMPIGGMGYGGLGPSGNVNITAGGGYNTGGGNVTIQSGATSSWASSNSFSKVTIQGGMVDSANAGGTIEVEGGHSTSWSNPPPAVGGNVWLIGGDASGGNPGGSIILAGGTGSTGGGVIISTNGVQPACNSSNRGMFWYIQGGINTKDSFEICAKDGSNSYAWRTLW